MGTQEGWGGLEKPELARSEPTVDDQLIAKVFSSEEGNKVLQALAKITLGKPVLQTIAAEGVNTAIFMALREGENNLYRKILAIKNRVNNERS